MATHKCLLAIEAYELTGIEIGKLREKYPNGRSFDDAMLPPFCLHENGTIRRTSEYLQWIDTDEEKFLLFYANTYDKLLSEEISNAGLNDLLQNINVKDIFEKFKKLGYDDIHRSYSTPDYLVIQLEYMCSYYNEYDCDLYTDVIGYLNHNLNFVEIIAPLIKENKREFDKYSYEKEKEWIKKRYFELFNE